jgi:hypothetical protein
MPSTTRDGPSALKKTPAGWKNSLKKPAGQATHVDGVVEIRILAGLVNVEPKISMTEEE